MSVSGALHPALQLLSCTRPLDVRDFVGIALIRSLHVRTKSLPDRNLVPSAIHLFRWGIFLDSFSAPPSTLLWRAAANRLVLFITLSMITPFSLSWSLTFVISYRRNCPALEVLANADSLSFSRRLSRLMGMVHLNEGTPNPPDLMSA